MFLWLSSFISGAAATQTHNGDEYIPLRIRYTLSNGPWQRLVFWRCRQHALCTFARETSTCSLTCWQGWSGAKALCFLGQAWARKRPGGHRSYCGHPSLYSDSQKSHCHLTWMCPGTSLFSPLSLSLLVV